MQPVPVSVVTVGKKNFQHRYCARESFTRTDLTHFPFIISQFIYISARGVSTHSTFEQEQTMTSPVLDYGMAEHGDCGEWRGRYYTTLPSQCAKLSVFTDGYVRSVCTRAVHVQYGGRLLGTEARSSSPN